MLRHEAVTAVLKGRLIVRMTDRECELAAHEPKCSIENQNPASE
jgi:hypothetical protein